MRSIPRALLAVALLAGLASASAAQELGVTVEAAIGRDIEDRMPVDTASTFPNDVGMVWCWTRVTGAEGTTIQHVWTHGANEWSVTLNIGGSPWRTYTSKNIPPEWDGEWRVEIRDAAGNVLKTLTFTIEEM